MANVFISLVFLLVAFFVQEVRAGEYCYGYSSLSRTYYTTYRYCSFGCCGTYNNQYCCSFSLGVIIGSVIGGILFVAVVIAVICCCIKKKTHTGRVVQPSQAAQTSVAVVYSGQAGAAQPNYGYGVQPGGAPGGQPGPGGYVPPPAYNYSDPAYPPGAVAPNPFAQAAAGSSAPPNPGFNVNGKGGATAPPPK